jgi:hypothetical protein
MRLLADNTGLHSAQVCLDGRASGDVDVQGLLQFATYLVFANNIFVNPTGYKEISGITERLMGELRALGIPEKVLQFNVPNSVQLTEACRMASDICAVDLEVVCQSYSQEEEGLYPSYISSALENDQTAFLRPLLQWGTLDEFGARNELTVLGKPDDAVNFMLSISADLRQAVADIGKYHSRAPNLDRHIFAFLRTSFNHALAKVMNLRLAPSIGRARLLREQNQAILQAMLDIVDTLVARYRDRHKGIPLGAPSVATSILNLSMGDPRGLICEALRLREKASNIRTYLASRTEYLDTDEAEDLFQIDKDIGEIAQHLAIELQLEPAPRLIDALEIQLALVPITISPAKLLDWGRHLYWKHHRIAVLTEMSKGAALSFRHEHYYKALQRRCCTSNKPEITSW